MRRDFQKWLHQYPVVIMVCCLGIGTVLAKSLRVNIDPFWIIPTVMVLIVLIPTFRKGTGKCFWTVGTITFLLLGFLQGSRALTWTNDFHPPLSKVRIHATVLAITATRPGAQTLIVDSGAVASTGLSLPGKGRIFLRYNNLTLGYGDRIAFSSRIRKPVNRGNPGEYDWELHCRNNKIAWLASAYGRDSLVVLHRGSDLTPGALVFRLRQAMLRFLETDSGRLFPEDNRRAIRAVLKGIILGDRGELRVPVQGEEGPSLRQAFAASGLAHMLSASGLHVGIVVLMVVAGVRIAVRTMPKVLLWIPAKKLAAVAAIPAIILYCLIVGSRIPSIRATVVATVAAGAILCDRKWNSFNTLALAALLILLVYPLALFSLGFKLSFAAVAGILLGVDPLWQRIGSSRSFRESSRSEHVHAYPDRKSLSLLTSFKRKLGLVLLTTMVATIAVLPFLLEAFHNFPSYTLISNLPAGFLLPVALSIGLPATVLGSVSPQLGALFLIPAECAVWGMVKIASFFSTLPGSTLSPPSWGTLQFILVLGVSSSALLYVRTFSLTRFLVATAMMLAAACSMTTPLWLNSDTDVLVATFLNVGQADAAVIKPPGSQGIMIDGGVRNRYFDTGQSIILPFMRWASIRSLDGVIVTHPEIDHMGGVASVIKDVRPLRLWLNIVRISVSRYQQLIATARLLRIPVAFADRTCTPVKLGRATLVFLNRPRHTMTKPFPSKAKNNASVVCKIKYGRVSFLLTGDLLKKGEKEILASGVNLRATVLKVGHHGSRSSSSERFLDRVKPAVAVISAGYPPRRRLPSRIVIERLKSHGAKVYWTGRDGAVIIRTDGKHVLHVDTGKGIHDVIKVR